MNEGTIHNAMRSTDKSFGNMDINEDLRQWAVEQSSDNDDEQNFDEEQEDEQQFLQKQIIGDNEI